MPEPELLCIRLAHYETGAVQLATSRGRLIVGNRDELLQYFQVNEGVTSLPSPAPETVALAQLLAEHREPERPRKTQQEADATGGMTVASLIAELSECDPAARVHLSIDGADTTYTCGWSVIDEGTIVWLV